MGIEQEEIQEELTDAVIDFDLDVKALAVCSNDKFKNINKTNEIRKIEKQLCRLQRSVARKYEMNKGGKPFRQNMQ